MWNGAEGIIVVSCGFLVSVNGYARNLQKDYYYALSPVPHVNTPRKNLRFLLKKTLPYVALCFWVYEYWWNRNWYECYRSENFTLCR